jgi:DNA-binding HxlR family transcriptional regulator
MYFAINSDNRDINKSKIAVLGLLSNNKDLTFCEIKDLLAGYFSESTLRHILPKLEKEKLIEHNPLRGKKGHPEYSYSIKKKGQEYYDKIIESNVYKNKKIVYDIDSHESTKGRLIVDIMDGHEINPTLIYQAIDRLLLNAAKNGYSQARFTLSVNAKISPKIARSVKLMDDLRSSADYEAALFKRKISDDCYKRKGGIPILPSWVVNFIWTNYALWRAIYPDVSYFKNHVQPGLSLEIAPLCKRYDYSWWIEYAINQLKRIRKLLLAFENRLETQPSTTYKGPLAHLRLVVFPIYSRMQVTAF